MKKFFQLSLSAIALAMLFAFATPPTEGLDATYGVASTDPSHIELHLHKDLTFTFQDLSNPNRSIHAKGTYTVKGQTIKLDANDGEISFHKKWKISKDGMKANARKGALFYTLCRLD